MPFSQSHSSTMLESKLIGTKQHQMHSHLHQLIPSRSYYSQSEISESRCFDIFCSFKKKYIVFIGNCDGGKATLKKKSFLIYLIFVFIFRNLIK